MSLGLAQSLNELGVCCIRRNPTKGIESLSEASRPEVTIAYVAFEEIPQRELRASLTVKVPCSVCIFVAFEEIPQRELRAARPRPLRQQG